MNKRLLFHLVEISPWPFIGSVGGFGLVLGKILWWHNSILFLLQLSIIIVLLTMVFWWFDVIREKMQGYHNSIVSRGLRMGMLYFILSEGFFFFRFFWAFFHKCWGPQSEIGYIWPPYLFNTILIDPFSIPLLKTVILLSSGIRITWSHFGILSSNKYYFSFGLVLTILLGYVFLVLQYGEYVNRKFKITRTVYGTVFFILTGFHGLHVIIGFIFLFICFIRLFYFHFSKNLHIGFEAASWYWHFVDVVWLFLYIFIYWYCS